MVSVGLHDIHCGPKSYMLKLLGKLVVQHGIRTSFDRRSCVQMSLPYIYIPNLLTPKESGCGCWPTGFCVSPCANMGLHMREGVRVHDIHCGPKYYIRKIGSSTVRLMNLSKFLFLWMLACFSFFSFYLAISHHMDICIANCALRFLYIFWANCFGFDMVISPSTTVGSFVAICRIVLKSVWNQ